MVSGTHPIPLWEYSRLSFCSKCFILTSYINLGESWTDCNLDCRQSTWWNFAVRKGEKTWLQFGKIVEIVFNPRISMISRIGKSSTNGRTSNQVTNHWVVLKQTFQQKIPIWTFNPTFYRCHSSHHSKRFFKQFVNIFFCKTMFSIHPKKSHPSFPSNSFINKKTQKNYSP